MRVSPSAIKTIARKQGRKLQDVLEEAGVSKTAYYSLVRKQVVVPTSVLKIAQALRVSTAEFLEHLDPQELDSYCRAQLVERIVSQEPNLDRDNVRHTLLLLDEPPIDRLRRALRRGRLADI